MSLSINKQHPRLYRIWAAMKQRCTNPNCTTFARYGGRGITVCHEWSSTFAVFARWALSAGYADHYSAVHSFLTHFSRHPAPKEGTP